MKLLRARIFLTLTACLNECARADGPAISSSPHHEPPKAYLCDGFNTARSDWSDVGPLPLGPAEDVCAPGYAYLAANFVFGDPRPPRNIAVSGRCCRLPDGVLLDEHVYTFDDCPEGTIATGARAERVVRDCPNNWAACVADWEALDHELRCTKINQQRYQLSPFRPAYVIGFHQGLDPRGTNGQQFTTRTRIPLGLRYGVARTSRFGLDTGRYIGFPWGSVLAAKRSKFDFLFRTIEFRGNPGDPPQGTPLQVVPPCETIDDPLRPNARCISGKEAMRTPASSEDRSAPPAGTAKLATVFLRHEARLLQLFWASSVSLEMLAASPSARIDSIARLNPDRWSARDGAALKDSLLANILGPLGEQEFYLQTIRDRDADRVDRKSATSKSFASAGSKILPLIEHLDKERNPESLRRKLRSISASLERSTRDMFSELGLDPRMADSTLALEPDEVAPLQALGIIGADQTPESVNLRSDRITQLIRHRPTSGGRRKSWSLDLLRKRLAALIRGEQATSSQSINRDLFLPDSQDDSCLLDRSCQK